MTRMSNVASNRNKQAGTAALRIFKRYVENAASAAPSRIAVKTSNLLLTFGAAGNRRCDRPHDEEHQYDGTAR